MLASFGAWVSEEEAVMKKTAQVMVTGPLAPYAAGYRRDLSCRGYSAWTEVSYLFSLARVSRWLAVQGLTAADLDASCVERFLAERPSGRRAGLLLASQLGDGADVGALTARHVNAFVLVQAQRRGAGSLNNVVTALRALLRFCYLRGYTVTPLAAAAPRTVGWRDRGPARDLGPGQVQRLLASCDRRTSTGPRDFAILVVLARLGLRANEVAALRVDDVDWRVGEITVRGKGNRTDRLPLPVDVGQAIAGYCRRGRPRRQCPALFVQAKAPYAALSSSGVSKVVEAACARAGLPKAGAHRLRHSAAVALRRAGAPLFEIGQLLRHQHAVTTAGYARDDQDALAEVARHWPGGAA